jgi:hypothetical protein
VSKKPKRVHVQWTTSLPPQTLVKLRKASERSLISMAKLVNEAIVAYLDSEGWKR